MIHVKTDDERELTFLFQRLSVILQRFNSVFPREGFEAEDEPDKQSFLTSVVLN